MRRFLVFVSLFLLLVGCTPAKPSQQQSTDRLSIDAPPPVNAPLHVTVSSAGVEPRLTDLQFADATHGWAAGPDFALTTTDGGNHWEAVAKAPPLPDPCDQTWSVQGIAVSHGANRFKAPLEGTDWGGTLHCSGSSAWVLFRGQAAMSKQEYVVFRTIDDGATWTPMLANGFFRKAYPTVKEVPAIDAYSGPFAVLDGETAIFAGECGPCGGWGTASLTRTRDGGRTWQHDNIPYIRSVAALSFADADHGWIVTRVPQYRDAGVILATADGGRTWQVQYPSAMLFPVGAVSMVDDRIGYGLGRVGDYEALLATRDGGATWRQIGRLPTDDQFPAYSADRLSFVDEQHGWALSGEGRLFQTADGGERWQEGNLAFVKRAATAIRFTTPQVGCLQEGDGSNRVTFWRTSDGGSTWQEAPGTSDVIGCARPVAVTKADTTLLEARPDGLLWTQAKDGAMAVSTDGGGSFRPIDWPSHATNRELLAVSFGSKAVGVAITFDRQFLRSTDGGATWATVR